MRLSLLDVAGLLLVLVVGLAAIFFFGNAIFDLPPEPARLVRTCAHALIEVRPRSAFVKLTASPDGPPLRHLVLGRIDDGAYDHLVLAEKRRVFRVRGGVVRERQVVRAAAPVNDLVLARAGSRWTLYAGDERLHVADIPEGGQPALLLAWEAGISNDARWKARLQNTEKLQFGDDFMRYVVGKDDGWHIEDGRWWIAQEAEKGAAPNAFMLQVKPGDKPARLTTGRAFWHDYRLEVSVQPQVDSTMGLLFGLADGGCYRVNIRSHRGDSVVELVETIGDRDSVLASRRICPLAGRWGRLGVEVASHRAVVVRMDGVRLFERSLSRPTFGEVGLHASGAGGRFDDISLRGFDNLPDPDPMQPVVQSSRTFKDKPWFDRDDRDKLLHRWASDTDAWEAASMVVDGSEWSGYRNSTPLFSDFAVEPAKVERRQFLALHDWSGAVVFRQQLAPDAANNRLERRGDDLLFNGKTMASLAGVGGVSLGLYGPGGIPSKAEKPAIRARHITQEFFESAPVDWRPVSGDWELTVRWQCKPKWNFFGGVGADDVILFSKNRCEGDQRHEFYYGMKDLFGREFEERRYARHDVNLSFCTNGRDLSSGYTFIYGGYHNNASFLLKGDKIVAWNDHARFPVFRDRDDTDHLHTLWWRFRVDKIGRRIRITRDDELIIDWTDHGDDAPTGGHFALWTYRNGIVYARVKSSAQTIRSVAGQYLTVPGEAEAGGWQTLEPARVRVETVSPDRIRVHNLFGGGSFAVQWALQQPVDLAATPVLRLPFRPHNGAKVSLPLALDGTPTRSLILNLTAPMQETYSVLGGPRRGWSSWDAFAAMPLKPPAVDRATFFDPRSDVVEINLLEQVRSRLGQSAKVRLKSLIVGNTSNHNYLLAGLSGNTSASWYELGRPQFLPAQARHREESPRMRDDEAIPQ